MGESIYFVQFFLRSVENIMATLPNYLLHYYFIVSHKHPSKNSGGSCCATVRDACAVTLLPEWNNIFWLEGIKNRLIIEKRKGGRKREFELTPPLPPLRTGLPTGILRLPSSTKKIDILPFGIFFIFKLIIYCLEI